MQRDGLQRGVTLIELMMAVFIASILLVIAVPSFQSLSLRSQQTNVINDLAALIGRGRSEAVTRNRTVIICASSDQLTCSGATTWESGWIAFVDVDRNSSMNSGDTLLQVKGGLPSGITLRSSGFDASSYLTISAGTGLLIQPGTFRYCDSRGVSAIRALNISLAGQVRVATDSNNDGAIEDYSGAQITSCP